MFVKGILGPGYENKCNPVTKQIATAGELNTKLCWSELRRPTFNPVLGYMRTIVERLAAFERAITTDELAAVWGMKPWTVREWIRTKRLPAYKLGNEWKIDPAEAMKFWNRRRVGGSL